MSLNFQQSSSSFIRRILAVVLLVVSLVLAVVYLREGDEGLLHSLQAGVRGGVAPISQVGAGLDGAAESATTALSDATASEGTLSQLRAQNAELRQLVSDAEESRQAAARLEGLLNMKESTGLEGKGAKIIGRSSDAWNQSLVINVGAQDGVSTGMAVMGASGVIGQISSVSQNTASVRLLTDANSGAAVMIQSSRAHGIVRGSLDGLLRLEDIDEGSLPSVGDVVITSGLGGSYVSGLLVGFVVSVEASSANATGTIVVSQNAKVSAMEEVFVVIAQTGAATDADSRAASGSGSSAGGSSPAA